MEKRRTKAFGAAPMVRAALAYVVRLQTLILTLFLAHLFHFFGCGPFPRRCHGFICTRDPPWSSVKPTPPFCGPSLRRPGYPPLLLHLPNLLSGLSLPRQPLGSASTIVRMVGSRFSLFSIHLDQGQRSGTGLGDDGGCGRRCGRGPEDEEIM